MTEKGPTTVQIQAPDSPVEASSSTKGPLRRIPICATEENNCPSQNTKLLLTFTTSKNHAASTSIQVKDVVTDAIILTLSSPKNKWRFIWDEKRIKSEENPENILTLRRKLMTISDLHVLLKGLGMEGDVELCRFVNRSHPSRNKAEIMAEFHDAMRDTKRTLLLKGSLESKKSTIYLGDPKKDGEKVIGKMTRVTRTSNNEEYNIDVAAGVDIVVIICMCIVVVEAKFKNHRMVGMPLK